MANVIEGPNTFTVGEWHLSNSAKLSRAELQRQTAKNCIAQTKQVICDRQEQTDRGQRDVSEKLSQRIENVKFWHSELSRQLSTLENWMDISKINNFNDENVINLMNFGMKRTNWINIEDVWRQLSRVANNH